jgi:hypothetical protein
MRVRPAAFRWEEYLAMSEPPTGAPSTQAQVQAYLHTIAHLLRDMPRLDRETQQLLAELVDELGRTLEAQTVPAAELQHIADQMRQLIEASHRGESEGIVGQVRGRLERAATALESRAPLVTGLTRRLIETLAELGI